MSPSGGPKFDDSSNETWILHPGLDDRIVLRQVAESGDWLFWGRRVSAPSSESHEKRLSAWQSMAIDELPHDLPFRDTLWRRQSSGPRDEFEYAIQLDEWQFVPDLIEEWGTPPLEVQQDWSLQLAGKRAANSKAEMVDLLASSDGRLVTLDELEAMAASYISDQVAFDAVGSDFPSLSRIASRLGESVQRSTPCVSSAWLQPHSQPVATTSKAVESSLGTATKRILDFPGVESASKTRKDFARKTPAKKTKFDRRVVAVGIGVFAMLVGTATWLTTSSSPSNTTQVASDTSNSAMSREREPAASVSASASTSAPELSEASSSLATQPEPIELTLSNALSEGSSVANDASASIESFMSRLGAGAGDVDMDVAVLESVQKMLATNGETAVVEETPGASSAATDPSGEPKPATENPFADLMDDESVPMTDESPANAVGKAADATEESGFLQESWTANRAIAKTTFRVPFRPLETNAVCRAELKLPKDLLYKPEGPLLLAGKQDVSWTVALEDDTVSLVVYLRSKPARSWYVATSIRAKVNDVEFPLGPSDAQAVVQRLLARNRWLDQQRAMLDSMKSNPKMKSGCTAAIREIDKEVKKTDKSLEAWQALASLASAFYKSHRIELGLAASNEQLPAPPSDNAEAKAKQ